MGNVRMYGVQGGVGASKLDEVIYGRDMDFDGDATSKDVDWLSHAGLKGREPAMVSATATGGAGKKIWPQGATQTRVGQVVFGQPDNPVTEKDQSVMAEHYHQAGGSSLFFSREPGHGPKSPEGKRMGKRIFKDAPMNRSVM